MCLIIVYNLLVYLMHLFIWLVYVWWEYPRFEDESGGNVTILMYMYGCLFVLNSFLIHNCIWVNPEASFIIIIIFSEFVHLLLIQLAHKP